MDALQQSVRDAIARSLQRLSEKQSGEGAWEGEVVWSPIITAQYIIVCHCIGKKISSGERDDFLIYFTKQQTPDGGWGLHPQSSASLFVTTIVYVAMRILAVSANDPRCAAARRRIHALGTALFIPAWGKLWLAFCNLYDYRGIHSFPTELWLLPRWLPFHPSRFYCHTRLIYLGMSYLWGKRYQRPSDDLCRTLRTELYTAPYDSIDFRAARRKIALNDCFAPPSAVLRLLSFALDVVERFVPRALRRRACDAALRRIEFEQRSTNYVSLSPVNGLLDILALHAAGPAHPDLAPSMEGVRRWLWRSEAEGARLCGARSKVWDTSFAVEAAACAVAGQKFDSNFVRAASFLRDNQIITELPEGDSFYRSPRFGGWGFSDACHGWPVSDTTAEALAAALSLRRRGMDTIGADALLAAVRFILSRQNPDGGWGSYERSRGSLLLERLNPAEMFGECMVEHSYVECTASALCALVRFSADFPGTTLINKISDAVALGRRFILSRQECCGGWQGFWGINYTYGTLFAVRGLLASGGKNCNETVQRACDWLVDHQKTDGGWGESWQSMLEKRYVEHPESQSIQTSWALITLLLARDSRREVHDRAASLLVERQRPGGWLREGVAGVFFTTAMLHYDLYREYFPLWALALYKRAYFKESAGISS